MPLLRVCACTCVCACVCACVCVRVCPCACVCVSSMNVIHPMIKVAATVVRGQSIYLKVRPQIRRRHLRTIPKL